MLKLPSNGENILNWARQATKEINSNIVHNGIGIKVVRSPQGTNISVKPSEKGGGAVASSWNMPFDVILGPAIEDQHGQVSNARQIRIMTNGAEPTLLYTVSQVTKRINPLNHSTYEVDMTIPLPALPDPESSGTEEDPNTGLVYIVVKLEYSDGEEDTFDQLFPIDYTFDTTGDLDAEDIISDQDGFQKIPIAYIQAVRSLEPEEEGEGEGDGGDSGEGDSGEDEEEEESDEPKVEGAYRTSFTQNNIQYVLVQLFHGDMHLFWKGPGQLTTCSVGTVVSGEGGTFTVNLEEWDGSEGERRVCACDLACTSYIPADTKIIAHPIETRYIGE